MQKQQEKVLIEAFQLMTVGERKFLLSTVKTMTEGRESIKPRLQLVTTSGSFSAGTLRSRHGS